MKTNDIDPKKLILAAIRENDLLPRPIRDHIGETDHGHEESLVNYKLTLPSGRSVSVECAPVMVGTVQETFVYDIIELK